TAALPSRSTVTATSCRVITSRLRRCSSLPVRGTMRDQAPSDYPMRRLAALTVACVVLLATACLGGHQSEVIPAPTITLTAQQAPRTGRSHYVWTTTRTVVVTCGANASIRGSKAATARSVCGAVDYYARHRPVPCGPHSDIAPFVRRV